jgi:hypothetical protein
VATLPEYGRRKAESLENRVPRGATADNRLRCDERVIPPRRRILIVDERET